VSDRDPHRPALVQAPVPPLDVDGLQAASVGTAVFAVVSVVLMIFSDRLEAAGDGWWLGVSLSGVALGLIGLAYCWRRRRTRLR
jgi:ABC-type nickel/cobalt efflux system permease component RcnA